MRLIEQAEAYPSRDYAAKNRTVICQRRLAGRRAPQRSALFRRESRNVRVIARTPRIGRKSFRSARDIRDLSASFSAPRAFPFCAPRDRKMSDQPYTLPLAKTNDIERSSPCVCFTMVSLLWQIHARSDARCSGLIEFLKYAERICGIFRIARRIFKM